MAIVTKTGAKAAAPAPRPTVTLPTVLSTPAKDIRDYTQLWYGHKGIGKTTLAAMFEKALFLNCEPGTKALRVLATPVRSYEELVATVDAICKAPKGQYKTFVVDTVDLAYEYAFQWVCKKKMIKHPNEENDFGQTWKEIRYAFREPMAKLMAMGGVIFLSHDTEKEIELRDGSKADRTQPTMAKQALEEIEGIVDIVGYYHYNGEDRYMRLVGNQTTVAKCRCEENFIRKGGKPRTPNDRILNIPMGLTAQEAYSNFMSAFNNEQVTSDPLAPVATPRKVLVVGKKK